MSAGKPRWKLGRPTGGGAGPAGGSCRPPVRLLALALLLCPGQPAAAWDSVGHRVIARLAWERLPPPAREAAVELLLAAPADADLASLGRGSWWGDRRRTLFELAATWPDLVRSDRYPARRDRYHRGAWHYVNFFWDQEGPGGGARDRPDLDPAPENVVERLGRFVPAIGDPGRPPGELAVELAWVLHLVGDLHQPLHCSARVTAVEPQGDRGGGLFELDRGMSLHRYWDGLLSRDYLWRSTGRLAARLARRHPAPGAEPGWPPPFEAWAREGYELSKNRLYPPTLRRGRAPDQAYRRLTSELGGARIVLAGERLAALLERALSPLYSRP